jgi:hypothetical protein
VSPVAPRRAAPTLLREAMTLTGLSPQKTRDVEAFAEIMGASRRTLYRWLKGDPMAETRIRWVINYVTIQRALKAPRPRRRSRAGKDSQP